MIRIRHVTKRFGSLCAVNDLNLDIPRGELFCFLGPNGAGKTTTIKLLTGLMRPTSGTIAIGGIDIQANPVAAKQLAGYIPDTPFLYERLTPAEFFDFTGDLYNVPEETIAREMESSFRLFGLMDYRNTLIKDLSHGYKQRLIYAATFLHAPQILFVDEPLVGIDPRTIRLIRDLLVSKAKAGMTIFLTTHILALAQDIANRIGIIANGRLVALGSMAALSEQSGKERLEDVFLSLTAGDDAIALPSRT